MLKIAIVGRPNVGKSALFNRIVGERRSIVDEAEGVTRDRIYAKADLFGYPFYLIDTAGIDPKSEELFNDEVKQQAEIAIEEADSIIMVVDGRSGPTKLDDEVAKILKRAKKPLTLAVSKIDSPGQNEERYNWRALGIPAIALTSAHHNLGIVELLESALREVKRDETPSDALPGISVAVVGRPNVGKSSFINKLLGDERVVVSPIAGTTRDAVDVEVTHGGHSYTFIDTAGIKRKGSEKEVVEKFARIRSIEAINRADVSLLIIDATQGITDQEKKIANQIEEAGKGLILLVNKWDLLKAVRQEHYKKALYETVPFLEHCPILFISSLVGLNLAKVFPIIRQVKEESEKRITTHQLNKFLINTMQRNHPPMLMGKRLRVYYMAQVDINPPRFVFFVNQPSLMTNAYKKYLYNQFRKEWAFAGVPILFYLRGKKAHQLES